MENALQIGKAGEYLVCADLILQGYVAYPSEQGLPYDVVVDVDGRLLKIQVKTTLAAKKNPSANRVCESTPAYFFHIKTNGKNKQKRYASQDVDIFALVALDRKTIGYMKQSDMKQCRTFRSDEFKGQYYAEEAVSKKALIAEMKEAGKSNKSIAEELEISLEMVRLYLQGRYGNATKGIYLSDLTFASAISKEPAPCQ